MHLSSWSSCWGQAHRGQFTHHRPYFDSRPANAYRQPLGTYQTDTFLPGTCYDLIAQGKVPKGGWARDNVNFLPKRDRDNDGKACDNQNSPM